MEKKQGIKARAKAHRESRGIDKNINHIDETSYIEAENSLLDGYKDKYLNEEETDSFGLDVGDGRARYHGERALEKKKGKGIKILTVLMLLATVAGVFGYIVYDKKYGLSKEIMDENEYYGTLDTLEEMHIIFNYENIEQKALLRDGMQYVPYDVVNKNINATIYWDYQDGLLLYSHPDYTEMIDLKHAISDQYDKPVAFIEAEELYISVEYIVAHTDIDISVHDSPNRVVIENEWDSIKQVRVKSDTQIRYRGGVKSDVLREVKKGENLMVLELGEEWDKVATEDGFVGYVQSKRIGVPKNVDREQTYREESYKHTLVDYKINLGWHQTTTLASNEGLNAILEATKGTLTTIAPTWFFINDTLGNVVSLASQEYVDAAHQQGVDVWATLNDFDGAIGSQLETYHALNSTQKREKIISKLINEVLKYGIDGINVDIELVSLDASNHYIQFIRELAIECRTYGIVLSIDNYPPKSYNSHYKWGEQAKVADYIVIMGYDEHYGGSKQAGPVSSITYTEEGITEMLKYVPAERLINAVPFYTRIWEVVEKTDAEKAADAGTDNEQYDTKVSSTSYGMAGAKVKANDAGAKISWDDETKHNFGTWTEGDKLYKVWFEDTEALKEKLKVMDKHKIAGVAAWKLGIEEPEVWDVIGEYLK